MSTIFGLDNQEDNHIESSYQTESPRELGSDGVGTLSHFGRHASSAVSPAPIVSARHKGRAQGIIDADWVDNFLSTPSQQRNRSQSFTSQHKDGQWEGQHQHHDEQQQQRSQYDASSFQQPQQQHEKLPGTETGTIRERAIEPLRHDLGFSREAFRATRQRTSTSTTTTMAPFNQQGRAGLLLFPELVDDHVMNDTTRFHNDATALPDLQHFHGDEMQEQEQPATELPTRRIALQMKRSHDHSRLMCVYEPRTCLNDDTMVGTDAVMGSTLPSWEFLRKDQYEEEEDEPMYLSPLPQDTDLLHSCNTPQQAACPVVSFTPPPPCQQLRQHQCGAHKSASGLGSFGMPSGIFFPTLG